MAATESFDNASSADKGPMEQEVEITFVIKCFKGDPLPEPKKPAKTMKEGAEEGEEGEEGEEEEEGTPPVPLEELECRFTLTMFNGETDQSEAITFIKPPEENEEAAEEEEGEEPSTPKPTETDEWSHTFTVTANVNEDVACQLCRSIDSSIGLHKAGLDVPMLLLPMDFAPFVAGDRSISLSTSLSSTELIQNPYNITNFSVDITIQTGFLTEGLEDKLNPLCVTIVAAEDLPDHPKYIPMGTWKDGLNPKTKSLQELRDACKPTYCTYQLISPPEKEQKSVDSEESAGTEESAEPDEETIKKNDWHVQVTTQSLPQSKKIRFKHKKVYMAGLMHPDDLIRHFKTTPLEIEVHDRDRILPPPPVSVGEGEEGEKVDEPPPIWSGLTKIDKSRSAEPLPTDPCAICTVERANLWPKRIEYAAFSAHEKPTAGRYVDCGSVLVVKVAVCRPLKNAELYSSGPFQRVVYRFEYSNSDILKRISDLIIQINAAALGTVQHKNIAPQTSDATEGDQVAREASVTSSHQGPINEMVHAMLEDGAGLDMLDKALTTVELLPEHRKSPTLDIITGVQVIDNNYRVFILEGLANGGIKRLLEGVPRISKNSKSFKLLYNPEITFPERLYAAYNVEIKRIKLRETLRHLIVKVDTFLEPKYELTAWALMRLNEISRAGRMKKLRDLVLFPEVAQLEHMYKKLGDALTIEDLTGQKRPEKKSAVGAGGIGDDTDVMQTLTSEEMAAAMAMPRPKAKPPTDSNNSVYVNFLATRPAPPDFVQSNIDAVRGEPRQQTKELDFGEVYNYSGQHLQYGKLQSDFQKTRYSQDYGKIHWTYSKDMLSGAFVLQDPDTFAKEEKKRSKERWLTKEGFQWPKAREPEMYLKQKKDLTDYRKDELKSEFFENEWNGFKYEPIQLPEGQPDFNIRYNTHPGFFEKDPEALRSVFAAESGAALEAQERKSKTFEEWTEKMVVDNKRFHTLWNSDTDPIARSHPLLRDIPNTKYLKTLPHPEGLQPQVPFPTLNTSEAFVDLSQTYIVDSYGKQLHFEERSLEDRTAVTRWKEAKAKGVEAYYEKESLHEVQFKPFGTKTKEQLVHKEKLHSRKTMPLTDKDRPSNPRLYRMQE